MSAVEAPAGLVENDRRVADRRAQMHVCMPGERRVKTSADLNSHERSRIEILLCEVQAAGEYAQGANEHALAAANKLLEALTAALEANAAATRAAHLAAGIVSGVSR